MPPVGANVWIYEAGNFGILFNTTYVCQLFDL